jgi:hypothetical protein
MNLYMSAYAVGTNASRSKAVNAHLNIKKC